MSEDISKLPKWAQNKLRVAEDSVASLRAKLDAFAGKSETGICIEPDAELLRRGNYPRYLGEHCAVEYKLQFGEIEIALRDGALRVMASGLGKIIVEPVASNVLTLRMVQDD